MSQTELGRRVGLEKSMISQIENGQRRPSFDKAIEIAALFGEPVEQVFAYIEVPA